MAGPGPRAFTVGRLIRQASALIGRHLGAFALATGVLVVLPAYLNGAASIAVVQKLSLPVAPPGQHEPLPGLAGALSGLLWLPLSLLLFAIVVRAAVADMRGERPNPRRDIAGALKLFLPILAITVLTYIPMGIGYALLVVPGIVLQCTWYVAVPAYMAERPGLFAAFGRSRSLTAGHRWPIFGLQLIRGAAFIGVAAINFYGLRHLTRSGAGLGELWILQLFDTVLSGALSLFGSAASATAYVELRRIESGALGPDVVEAFA